MYGINQVIVMGTVAAEPDFASYEGGRNKAGLFIAVNTKEQRVDKESGEVKWTDVTRWVSAEFWGTSANFIQQYVKKGSNVAIQGKFSLNSWTNDQGEKRSKAVVEGDEIRLIGSTSSTKKQNAESVLRYLEKLQNEGFTLEKGIESLKTKLEMVSEAEQAAKAAENGLGFLSN